MFAHVSPHALPLSNLCRWLARWTAAVLVTIWATLAVRELFRPDFHLTGAMLVQGGALAVAFAGYALGWRHEVVGGLVALAGAAALSAIVAAAQGPTPGASIVLFALPGLLYLEAWTLDRPRHARARRSLKAHVVKV